MAANPNRRIKLNQYTQTIYSEKTSKSYRLSVTATDGELMPNEIFLYLHKDPTINYPDGQEIFQGICSPTQLQTLPINSPDSTQPSNLFYRTASMDKTYSNKSDADSAWASIVEAVNDLKTALDFSDGLTTTSYWVGIPPVGG